MMQRLRSTRPNSRQFLGSARQVALLSHGQIAISLPNEPQSRKTKNANRALLRNRMQKPSMSWDPFGLLNESEIEVRFALSLVRVQPGELANRGAELRCVFVGLNKSRHGLLCEESGIQNLFCCFLFCLSVSNSLLKSGSAELCNVASLSLADLSILPLGSLSQCQIFMRCFRTSDKKMNYLYVPHNGANLVCMTHQLSLSIEIGLNKKLILTCI